jgi:hypothetical protein
MQWQRQLRMHQHTATARIMPRMAPMRSWGSSCRHFSSIGSSRFLLLERSRERMEKEVEMGSVGCGAANVSSLLIVHWNNNNESTTVLPWSCKNVLCIVSGSVKGTSPFSSSSSSLIALESPRLLLLLDKELRRRENSDELYMYFRRCGCCCCCSALRSFRFHAPM